MCYIRRINQAKLQMHRPNTRNIHHRLTREHHTHKSRGGRCQKNGQCAQVIHLPFLANLWRTVTCPSYTNKVSVKTRHLYNNYERGRLKAGGYKRWTNDGQTMDNSWINASSLEFTVSSIGCAYRAEFILGR